MDLAGYVSKASSKACIFFSDVEGYVEKISYCLIGVSSYLEVEFLEFSGELFLHCLIFFCRLSCTIARPSSLYSSMLL